MNGFLKLLYKLGDYDDNVIKVGQLSTTKYLLPGLSLFIVLITSCFGGWHLADTMTSGWYRFPFTLVFVSLILLVDFSLMHGEKSKWTAGLRVVLSVTLGFIISLLTTLVIFQKDIVANYNEGIHNQVDTATSQRKEDIIYWKSLVRDSIPKFDKLSTDAHKGLLIVNGEKIPACSGSQCLEKSLCQNNARTRDGYIKEYDSNKKYIENEEDYIKGKQDEVKARNSDGIVGQISNLWKSMGEPIIFIGVTLIFIALMVVDLMPISIKFGLKEKLDTEYNEKKKELENEKDSEGNPRYYNFDKELFFSNSQKRKIEIEAKANKQKIESIALQNDFDLAKFNEGVLKKMNSLYALEKYQELLQYFKDKNVPEEKISKLFDELHKAEKSDE